MHSSRIYKWDICAPNAILNNLGGRLTKLNGQNIDYSTSSMDSKDADFDTVEGGIIASLYNYDYFFKVFKNKV